MTDQINQSENKSNGPIKTLLPFVLPLLAIGLIIFVAFSWFNSKAGDKLTVPPISSKVEIENLNPEDQAKLGDISRGIGDYKTLKLIAQPGVVGSAQLRYEIKDAKVFASVIAGLPALNSGESYQLWLKTSNAAEWQKSNVLNVGKGGFLTTLAISQDKLPIEFKITHEGTASTDTELILFTGKLAE